MEDGMIIELYWRREEAAIGETEKKYGGFCRYIAGNILDAPEDCEECVSDTLLRAWNTIPPQRPQSLKAYLGRIVRNASISRFRHLKAQKRGGMEGMLSELDDCVPSGDDVQASLETAELTGHIDRWLDSLPAEDRVLFVRRYWYGDGVNVLAEKCGVTPAKMARKMYSLRLGLKEALSREGVCV